MNAKSPEMLSAELLKGPFGFTASMNLLELIKDRMLESAVIPLEATLNMDPVSGAILTRTINPLRARVIDFASVAIADRLAIDSEKTVEDRMRSII